MSNNKLPEVTNIEVATRIGDNRPAVTIWFGNSSALRYVWDDESDAIREQTYVDGCVHDDLAVGGNRDKVALYALYSLAEYINTYRDNPHAAESDWPHIYEMLTA